MITAESNQPEEKALPSAQHTMSLASTDLLQRKLLLGLGATAGAALGKGAGQCFPTLVLAEVSLWIKGWPREESK